MTELTPEQSRINQSKYRDRQRTRGMGLINKWIPIEMREDVYDIIDKINSDFEKNNQDFVRFAIAFLDAQDGTEIRAQKRSGHWRFILKDPTN